MEVEAKFSLADASALAQLADLPALAGFGLGPGERRQDRDTFLDTDDRRFLAAGYYLRRRETSGGVRLTLKQLASDPDGVLRREELEALVAADVPPAEWPPGELRDRVQGIAEGASLRPFLTLAQERLTRVVFDGAREVAELSLDSVTVGEGDKAERWSEVEIELRPDGSDDDLARLSVGLRELTGAEAEPRSKFARALAIMERDVDGPAGEGGRFREPDVVTGLLGSERSRHEELARRDDAVGRRATALLALHDGLTQVEAGRLAGISDRRVRYWLARYRSDGLAIYGPEGREDAARTTMTDAVKRARAEGGNGAKRTKRERAPGSESAKRPPIDPTDTMTAAAVATLRFHLARMLEHEEGTRLGEDPEELHDMRVSTRRMRMALRVFADHLDRETMRPMLKGLRRTGATLGAVRDLDVFNEKTHHYLETQPGSRKGELQGLLAACHGERERQREQLVAYLDGPRYRRFVETATELVEGPLERLAPQAGAPLRPQRVAQVLPGILYRDMAAVWVFEGQLGGVETPLERYHALRKACKGLRYTLEFFEGVLGPDARPLIKKVKGMQDHLGDLQDALVTCGILRDYITWGEWRHEGHTLPLPEELIISPDAARYMAARQEEMERLVLTFPEVWPSVAGSEFSRGLANVIAEI
jgi:CHAD domain-containing protein